MLLRAADHPKQRNIHTCKRRDDCAFRPFRCYDIARLSTSGRIRMFRITVKIRSPTYEVESRYPASLRTTRDSTHVCEMYFFSFAFVFWTNEMISLLTSAERLFRLSDDTHSSNRHKTVLGLAFSFSPFLAESSRVEGIGVPASCRVDDHFFARGYRTRGEHRHRPSP